MNPDERLDYYYYQHMPPNGQLLPSSLQEQFDRNDANCSPFMMSSPSLSHHYYPTQTMLTAMVGYSLMPPSATNVAGAYPFPVCPPPYASAYSAQSLNHQSHIHAMSLHNMLPTNFLNCDHTAERQAMGFPHRDMTIASNYDESNGCLVGNREKSYKRNRDSYEHYQYPIEPEIKQGKKKRIKRSDDMPRRPLSAYNFFFSEEREMILAILPDPVDGKHIDIDAAKDVLSKHELNEEEEEALVKKVKDNSQQLLNIHLEGDRKKKKHQKSHGKIAFQTLAKLVGQRWRALSKEKKAYYESLANDDMGRYDDQSKEV